MSLISILVLAVAILAFLSSLLVLIGAAKSDRVRMAWYFVSMGFGSVWAACCALYLMLPETATDVAPLVIAGIYLGGAMMMLGLLGYGAWHKTVGKVAVGMAIVYIVGMTALLINKPTLMFDGFTLSAVLGNSVQLVPGWAFWSYSAFYGFCTFIALFFVWKSARQARLKRTRQGDMIFLVGWIVAGLIAAIFNMVLPFFRYDLIWVGPLALGLLAIVFYYVLLKFRTVSVSSTSLKVLSSIVMMIGGAIIYMLIFYIIFTALFKMPNPSTPILVLNFLMVVILLLLMPVIREISASINSLISVGQVDIAYVIKKLNHIASKNVDLRDLAGFLADHLHFAYIGFIINGRLYGSKSLAISPAELNGITHLKSSTREVWQEPNKSVQKTFDELGLKAVAELRNAKGKPFGQLVVGKPLGKSNFERRDLIQLEMIINLVATVIDSEKHLRA